jgi:hypothetical protein
MAAAIQGLYQAELKNRAHHITASNDTNGDPNKEDRSNEDLRDALTCMLAVEFQQTTAIPPPNHSSMARRNRRRRGSERDRNSNQNQPGAPTKPNPRRHAIQTMAQQRVRRRERRLIPHRKREPNQEMTRANKSSTTQAATSKSFQRYTHHPSQATPDSKRHFGK